MRSTRRFWPVSGKAAVPRRIAAARSVRSVPTTANSFYHWGVSVLAEGKIDTQRGFTYGYGTAPTRAPASATRYPLLSIRYRNMGTLEYGVDTAYSGSNGTLPTGGAAITGVSQTATQTVVTCSSATWTPSQWVNKYFFSRAATLLMRRISGSLSQLKE